MSELVVRSDEPTLEWQIQSSCRIYIDGPRVFDLDLGKWQGLERPRKIREVIEGNRERLEAVGSLPFERANPGPEGGRPGTEYWLNEQQALLLCMWSKTERAYQVQTTLVRVFMAVRRGELTAIQADKLTGLEVMRPFLEQLDRIKGDLSTFQEETRSGFSRIEQLILQNHKSEPRRDFTAETRRTHIAVIEIHGGRCPCCRAILICHGGRMLPNANEEHFFSRHKRGLRETWITCADCNQRLERDTKFRLTSGGAFDAYQRAVQAWLSDEGQRQLFLM